MGEIASSDRMVSLFYNSSSNRAKQTLACARAEVMKQPIALRGTSTLLVVTPADIKKI
jgi:hypothetical protein